MSEAPKLLPCPFCGRTDDVGVREYERDDLLFVACPGCWAEGPAGDNPAQAVERWNRRALSPGEIERLTRELAEARGLLTELATDVETAAQHNYPDWPSNPSSRRRYDRDMEPVRRARALIARLDAE